MSVTISTSTEPLQLWWHYRHETDGPPQFEARNDFDIFRELCRRFNREEAFTEGLDEMGWLKRIWQEGVQQGKGRGVHLPAFDDFWNNKEYVEFDHPQMFVRHQAFREIWIEPLVDAEWPD